MKSLDSFASVSPAGSSRPVATPTPTPTLASSASPAWWAFDKSGAEVVALCAVTRLAIVRPRVMHVSNKISSTRVAVARLFARVAGASTRRNFPRRRCVESPSGSALCAQGGYFASYDSYDE